MNDKIVPDETNSVPIRRGVFIQANDRRCQVVDLGSIDKVGENVTGILIQRKGCEPQHLIMTQKMLDMVVEAILRYRIQPDVEGTKDYYAVDESLYDGDNRKEELNELKLEG